jgi:ectoine hydroxylase-related dioxygenase (phytanoyl-CoA dioxygenase family)
MQDEFPGLTLLVVGTDVTPGAWFSAQLRARVAELGLEEQVRFLGRRDDVEALMAAADIFVMPSFEEPFGLVFCEAMAMGKPVVALDDGGTPEVVEHERTGLLSARGDLDALTANVARLLRDADARATLGAAGRRKVLEDLTTKRMAADVATVYHKVCRAGRPTSSGNRGSESMTVLERPSVEQFREAMDVDGYAVIRGVVSPDRLTEVAESLTAEYERLKAADEMFAGGGSLSGHLNCFPGEQTRFVLEEIQAAGIQDLVRAIRPDIADSLRATLNFNLPGSVAQHYHTDGLYTKDFLICNIAVVDTDLRNGAIDVLPGTHREFYKFWRYTYHRLWRLSTRLPLRQGDVVVRRSTVWHRGMPNFSSTPRPMMAITFGEMDDLDADPFMLNDGKPMFFPNWYRTDKLGQLREKTFIKAPWTYSAWRFARSLYGNKGYSSF